MAGRIAARMDMDMGGMGGMMMGTNLFQDTNMQLARVYWYTIVGVLVFAVLVRLVDAYKAQSRLRTQANRSIEFPTKPRNWFLKSWATLTAVVREATYPQLWVPVKFLSWLTPPPLGRMAVLFAYWSVIIFFMTWNAIIKDANFWERIGFRNAWITITQVPLLYLLASKCSILAVVGGSSYERFNWLHRWVARTMFVTATVHGWHFYTEWSLAGDDFVQLTIGMMPMVKWGFGAWGILLFQLTASLWPFRRLSYELFVAQHVISAIVFLYVVYVHVPSYAMYNVWFAIAAMCFDRFYRAVMFVWQNVNFGSGGQRLGHRTLVRAVGDKVTLVTVKDVHFKWHAGQHVYLNIPAIGPMETHPYTIARAHKGTGSRFASNLQLVVRSHDGFSGRLHRFAKKKEEEGVDQAQAVTAFVTGPYGAPPRWDIYETLVLIAASTGASFTLPILESVLQTNKAKCAKRIDFLLTAKEAREIQFYVDRLHEMVDQARNIGVALHVHIAVTREQGSESLTPMSTSSATSSPTRETGEKRRAGGDEATAVKTKRVNSDDDICDAYIQYATQRPDVQSFIRMPVEATGGETSVVVCGGPSLVATVRNTVARLSDERGVHKGTGAQGIHLFVEEFCF